jgi:hypothetical protein
MLKPFTLVRTVSMLLLAASASVLCVPLQAQSKDIATAIEVQGQVSVVRGGQVALFQNGTAGPGQATTVRVGEVIFTGPDGHGVFQIGDGSTFEVFPSSRVTFRDSYNFLDMLQLVLGKIRVQIEHRNGPNPKRVSTPTAVISVRGTIFDVSVEDDDGTTLVSVEEGLVEVQHRLQAGPPVLVPPNQSVHIYPNQPLAKMAGPGIPVKVFDKIKAIAVDTILHPPGGSIPGGSSGGGIPGGSTGGSTPGSQGDGGKNKKGPPAGTPPGAPPPPPGGGN